MPLKIKSFLAVQIAQVVSIISSMKNDTLRESFKLVMIL
jgi:hypothetical protein